MKFVVLRRDEDGLWEHVGAQEVEVPFQGETLPRMVVENAARQAVERVGRAGVFVAVPFDDWVMLEAEAQITVKPVSRSPVEEVEPLADDDPGPLVDLSELEGMHQGPRIV